MNENIYIHNIENIQDLLGQLDHIKAELGFEKIWFRGVADTAYGLEPSIFRRAVNPAIEKDLYNKFKVRALPFLDQEPNDNYWEWLFYMQHYGVPTRLLDWSESALIGLAFSVIFREEKHQDKDAALWCLDPIKLNRDFVKGFKPTEILPNITDPTVQGVQKYSDPEIPVDYPVAVYGPQNNERIVAQKGVFTLFPFKERLKLEDLPTSHNFLAKIIIRNAEIDRIKSQLITLGITETLVYPGLDYLADEIKREVFN
ncbi:MAG: FRG domain-containing protein [Ignavibacteriaceae bacterium]|nr:FRG domain-containing protein [Ignavibacteriaceae bacterium]